MKNKIIILTSCCLLFLFGISTTPNIIQAAVTSLPKVQNVKVKEKGNKYVTLTWKKISQAKSYKVKVFTKNKKTKKIVSTTKKQKKITKLKKNTTYYFKVRAVRGTIKGKWSDYKKVKTRNESTNDEEEEEENDEEDAATPTIDFSAAAYSGAEDSGAMTVTASLSAASSSDVAVDYASSDGTATAGTDYTAVNSTLTITAGETSGTFTLTPTSDTSGESDETVTLTLSNPTNATLATTNNPATITITNDDLTISSSAFADGANIPDVYTCASDDESPALSWTEIPEGTQSMVLIVRDIDAGGDFFHWGVKEISTVSAGVAQNSVPEDGSELTNDFVESGYGGPCPPIDDGSHTYQFEIYALDTGVISGISWANQLDDAIESHIIESHYITGEYDRN